MENFKINTTCTYALKQDHAGFTGFYTRNCAIVLLVYENVRFRSYFIFTMDACARAFHNSLANWVSQIRMNRIRQGLQLRYQFFMD